VRIVQTSLPSIPVSTTQHKLVPNATYLGWLRASRHVEAVQRGVSPLTLYWA
jgi:hypothetical protein